ncbi:hypothetical protein PFISCL1PPCAC_19909, partial [Pristionchus fissidentatus]
IKMSSGFVSSSELNEERQKRQDEWDKVRKAEDPIDTPELEVCNKSLFEQLKHNKDKKEVEMAEERALKNLVRGIDEDESQFLSMMNEIERNDKVAKKKEEALILAEMAVIKGQIGMDSELNPPPSRVNNEGKTIGKSKQALLITSLIKRKNTVYEKMDEKKARIGEEKEEKQRVIGGLVDYGSDSDE